MEAAPRVSTNLTQLFARLIVCAVFLPTGARHLFQMEKFTPEEAQRLEQMESRLPSMGGESKPAKPAKKVALRDEGAEQEPARDPNTRRSLGRVALRLDDAHVPQPLVVAWVIAVLELAGSMTVLVGFLTSLVTPALALIGAFTLWKAVWPELGGAMPWTWSVAQSQMAVTWLAGTLLPVSVFLTGPGKPSIEASMKGGKGGAKKAPAEA